LRLGTLSPRVTVPGDGGIDEIEPPHSYITVQITSKSKPSTVGKDIDEDEDEAIDDEEPTEELEQEHTLIITAQPNGLWTISSKSLSKDAETMETKDNVSTAELLTNLKHVIIHEVSID
jgi:hypothetical protein